MKYVILAFLSVYQVSFGSKGFFISIDGLHPEILKTMLDSNALDAPKGFRYLYENSYSSFEASPVEITLTAPSHVAIITCSSPANNGIIANSMRVNGKVVSGFSHPFKTEALWTSSMAQGKKVLSVAYAGNDGNDPSRSATYGISYPDTSLFGKSQVLEWNDNFEEVKEIRVIVNNKTKEEKVFKAKLIGTTKKVLVLEDMDNSKINIQLALGNNLSENIYFYENLKTSSLYGYKRRILVQDISESDEEVKVYFSASTFNKAYPEDYRKYLESINLIWNPETHHGDDVGPVETLKYKVLESNFLTDVAVASLKKYPVDIVLYYQPLIDSMEHSYFANLKLPLDVKSNDPYSVAIRQAYQIVDKNLSNVLAFGMPSDVVALMGDHGMEKSLSAINISKALKDLSIEDKVEMVTSGSLALLYSKDGSNVDAQGEALAKYFKDNKWNGSDSITHYFSKSKTGNSPWNYGQAEFAYMTHAQLYYSTKPKEDKLFIEASAKGMHGQHKSLSGMNTALFIKDKSNTKKNLGKASLIDAVPSFSKALGIKPPKDCEGKSLIN